MKITKAYMQKLLIHNKWIQTEQIRERAIQYTCKEHSIFIYEDYVTIYIENTEGNKLYYSLGNFMEVFFTIIHKIQTEFNLPPIKKYKIYKLEEDIFDGESFSRDITIDKKYIGPCKEDLLTEYVTNKGKYPHIFQKLGENYKYFICRNNEIVQYLCELEVE